MGRLLRQVHHVLRDEGFTPHPDKQRVMHAGSRQEVTGVVVNQKPSVSRRERRNLRAALHNAQRNGLAAATWQGQPATRDVLVGYARFVQMVDARQGAALLPRALALPGGAPSARPVFADQFRRQSAQGEAPALARGTWWQPAEPPAPVLALTAGQMKAARQERLNARRAERNAASKPAPQHAAEPRPPIRWWQHAIQLFIVVHLAMGMKSALVFVLGMLWVGYALISRRPGWLRFAIVMIGIALIGSVLRV